MSLNELMATVKRQRQEALAMLLRDAQPGTIWGTDRSKFGALVVGECVPNKTRVCRFDDAGFTGHADVDDAPEYLLELFGLHVRQVSAPEWMR